MTRKQFIQRLTARRRYFAQAAQRSRFLSRRERALAKVELIDWALGALEERGYAKKGRKVSA